MMGKQRHSLLRTLLRIIPLALISAVIGIRLYLWNAQRLVGNAMPMPFGWGASVVLSGSMEPALSVDDLVLVRAQKNYQPGEIVVYQEGSILVIHRIISIDGESLVTQGDANSIADEPIRITAVKGKAVGRIRHLGVAVRFLQTPTGFLILLAITVLLFELPYYHARKHSDEELQKIKDEIRRLKNES